MLKMKKRTKKTFRNALIYLIIISSLSLLAYGYKHIKSYMQQSLTTFTLQEIDIKGNHILSRKEVLKLCGLESGKKLLTIRPSEVVEKLRKSPYIKAASAVRSLPSTLRINIAERKPVAFIHGRGLNLIDEEGVLIPVPRKNMRWNLPFITGAQGRLGVLGERAQARSALKGVQILSFVGLLNSSLQEVISEIDMSKKEYAQLVLVRGGAKVKLNYNNFEENLYILSEYLEKYLDWKHLTSIEYFDIRFKNQLILKDRQS